MALDLGELVAKLRVDDSQYRRGLQEAPRTAEQAGARIGESLHRGAAPLVGKLGRLIGAIGLGYMATEAVKFGVSTAGAMEQASIAFTTMLGSGKKAKTFLDQLKDFAARTPFEFPELQTAAQSLISIGIDASKVIPIMTTLGNVTSGMGTGSEGVKRATVAIQQMIAAQRVSAEDLNQLRDAGIPVYQLLASATGKTVAQVAALAQKGKLGKKELDAMMRALESGKGLERFKGMMDKQSESLLGLWSTLQDTFGQGLAKIFQDSGLVDLLKNGLGGAIAGVSAAIPPVTAGIKWLVTQVTRLLGLLGPDFTTIVTESFKDLAIWSGKIWSTLKPGFSTLATAARQVWQYIGPMVSSLRSLGQTKSPAPWVGHMAIGAERAKSALSPLIGWITGALIPAANRLFKAYQDAFTKLAPIIVAFAQQFWARIQPLLPQIQAIFGQIGGIITDVMDLIATIVTEGTAIVQAVWDAWGNDIVGAVTYAWHFILGVIQPVLGIIQGVVRTVTAAIKGDWSGAWAGIQQVSQSTLDMIHNIIVNTMDGIVGAIKFAWTNMVNSVTTQLGGLLNAVDTNFPLIGSVVRWLWNDAFAPAMRGIVTAIGWVLDGIGNMLDGLGQIPGFEWAKTAATNMHGAANKAKELANNIRDIPSHVPITVAMSVIQKVVKTSGSYKSNTQRGYSARAAGGPVLGGFDYLVGENGPEILRMPGNGTIIPAPQTAQMLNQAADGPSFRPVETRTGTGRVNIYGNVYGDTYLDEVNRRDADRKRAQMASAGIRRVAMA